MNPEVLTPDYIFTFGRNRGRRLNDVDVGYIAWCRKEISWFRDAYDRMVNGETVDTIPSRLSDEDRARALNLIQGTTATQIIMDDVSVGRATDGGGNLGEYRPRRYGPKDVISEPTVDIGWLDRMGINFDRDRGRV